MTYPDWRPTSDCVKCGYYADADDTRFVGDGRLDGGYVTCYLERECRRCRYTWPEACLDA